MMKIIEEFRKISNGYLTPEVREFVGKLSEEEWKELTIQLPKNPGLGRLSEARKKWIEEHSN